MSLHAAEICMQGTAVESEAGLSLVIRYKSRVKSREC